MKDGSIRSLKYIPGSSRDWVKSRDFLPYRACSEHHENQIARNETALEGGFHF